MIQLVSDTNSNRNGNRPAANDSRNPLFENKQGRGGHAWPFPSRYAVKSAPQNPQKNQSSGS